ncbi:hypothetical protein LIPSTDRAFT_217370 [Lipomyces starkeyi NRRL Y-11557]|uniref:Uncharacterized protein n=1 Tax=Lipomyces starkeyi NRRL Y-11557 TaxID=675824 RepID=A0A1E3QDM1_LIPST|nr:hypothetical protein LIPSTDRAFT_217370 [Lipomyces starkeyi NRRL Y-11557]
MQIYATFKVSFSLKRQHPNLRRDSIFSASSFLVKSSFEPSFPSIPRRVILTRSMNPKHVNRWCDASSEGNRVVPIYAVKLCETLQNIT